MCINSKKMAHAEPMLDTYPRNPDTAAKHAARNDVSCQEGNAFLVGETVKGTIRGKKS